MKFTYWVTAIVVVCILWTSSGISSSQERDSAASGEVDAEQDQTTARVKEAEIHHVVETLREAYLLQELDLPEEKAHALLDSMRKTEEARSVYLARRYAIENELQDILARPGPDQTQIAKTLQLLETAQRHYHQQLIQTHDDLKDILTPEEQARYVLFQRNFNRRIRRLIMRIRQQNSQSTLPENQLLRRQDTESVIRQPE